MQRTTQVAGSGAPDLQGVRGTSVLFHPETNQRSKKQPPSPSASSAVHTEIKTMSNVSANMVLISLIRPCAPTLHGGESTQEAERPGRDFAGPTLEEHSNFDSTDSTLPLPGHRPGTARFTLAGWPLESEESRNPQVSGAEGARQTQSRESWKYSFVGGWRCGGASTSSVVC